ncbi:MAG: cysteine desulfurase NifS [Intestinibacillus sp.]
MAKHIYLDHAATSPLSAHALEAMLPYLTGEYGNPSSVYAIGRTAKRAVEDARSRVAEVLGASPDEIFFTSGGTESDNWAIKAAAAAQCDKGRHIISTPIEHSAVLHTLEHLAEQGCDVTYLDVDTAGNISLDALRAAIRPDTVLITIMAANNEIGTILPTAEIGRIAREHGVLFHTDAVQAAGHIPINTSDMMIDLLSLSGHKFGGPKGTGALYIRRDCGLPSYMHGGSQERGRRAGTENVAGIVGLATALEDAAAHMEENRRKVSALRDRLIDGLLRVPGARLTGDPVHRLPGTASFVFEGVEGEALVILLDQAGICASAGSACASGSIEPSRVLTAIGLPRALAQSSLRLSLSEHTAEADVNTVLEILPQIIRRIRNMTAQ